MDPEDLIKSIHKATHPAEYEAREPKIIHTPIDWSKRKRYPKQNSTQVLTIDEDIEGGRAAERSQLDDRFILQTRRMERVNMRCVSPNC